MYQIRIIFGFLLIRPEPVHSEKKRMHILCQIGEFLPKTVQIPCFDACQLPPVSFRECVIDVFPFHGPVTMPGTERRVRCHHVGRQSFFPGSH